MHANKQYSLLISKNHIYTMASACLALIRVTARARRRFGVSLSCFYVKWFTGGTNVYFREIARVNSAQKKL